MERLKNEGLFKPWKRASVMKPYEGERVFCYFNYRPSSRQRYRASSYGYGYYRPHRGWVIEGWKSQPAELKVVTWQREGDVDWDQMAYNNGWISSEELKRRKYGFVM